MLKCINLKHNSSQIQLISLSDCSAYLVTGVGGKLSRPVYLDPHPPEYQSKKILLSFLIPCSAMGLSAVCDMDIF